MADEIAVALIAVSAALFSAALAGGLVLLAQRIANRRARDLFAEQTTARIVLDRAQALRDARRRRLQALNDTLERISAVLGELRLAWVDASTHLGLIPQHLRSFREESAQADVPASLNPQWMLIVGALRGLVSAVESRDQEAVARASEAISRQLEELREALDVYIVDGPTSTGRSLDG